MIVRSLTLVAILAVAGVAQEGVTAKPAPAQDKAQATEAENLFYHAFFLDRGARRSEEAIALYKEFLAKAPTHHYAGQAAQNTVSLLDRSGKTEEAGQFREKYAAILKNADMRPAGDQAGDPQQRGQGRQRGQGNRPNLDELKAELAKAKEAGDEAKVKELDAQIKRVEARGQGGQNGQRGRGNAFDQKITDMSDEELAQYPQRLDRMSRRIDMMRNNGQGDQADKLEKGIEQIKKLLKEGKKEDAEKIRADLAKDMTQRRGGGGGGR